MEINIFGSENGLIRFLGVKRLFYILEMEKYFYLGKYI